MNLDSQTIERVLQFTAFVDFIQNPASTKAALSQLADLVEQYKEQVAQLTDTKGVDVYKQEVMDSVAKAQQDLDEATATLNASKVAFEDLKTQNTKDLDVKLANITAKQLVLDTKEKDLTARESVLAPKEANLALQKNRLDSREVDLLTREADLKQKSDALQALLK